MQQIDTDTPQRPYFSVHTERLVLERCESLLSTLSSLAPDLGALKPGGLRCDDPGIVRRKGAFGGRLDPSISVPLVLEGPVAPAKQSGRAENERGRVAGCIVGGTEGVLPVGGRVGALDQAGRGEAVVRVHQVNMLHSVAKDAGDDAHEVARAIEWMGQDIDKCFRGSQGPWKREDGSWDAEGRRPSRGHWDMVISRVQENVKRLGFAQGVPCAPFAFFGYFVDAVLVEDVKKAIVGHVVGVGAERSGLTGGDAENVETADGVPAEPAIERCLLHYFCP